MRSKRLRERNIFLDYPSVKTVGFATFPDKGRLEKLPFSTKRIGISYLIVTKQIVAER